MGLLVAGGSKASGRERWALCPAWGRFGPLPRIASWRGGRWTLRQLRRRDRPSARQPRRWVTLRSARELLRGRGSSARPRPSLRLFYCREGSAKLIACNIDHQRPRARGQRPPERRLLGVLERAQWPRQLAPPPQCRTPTNPGPSGRRTPSAPGRAQADRRSPGFVPDSSIRPSASIPQPDRGTEQRVGPAPRRGRSSPPHRARLLGEVALGGHLGVTRRARRARPDLRRRGEALLHPLPQAIRAPGDGGSSVPESALRPTATNA